jgi:hypothetical protein
MTEQRTEKPSSKPTGEVRTIERAAKLTALMAEDEALWAGGVHIETAYVQQALRYLAHYIEGDWTYKQTRAALKEMQP